MGSYDHITKTYNGSKQRPTEYGVDISPYLHGGDVFRTSGKDDYLKLGKQNYTFDAEGYRKAQFDWMRGSSAYDDWTDDDINGFLDSINEKYYTNNEVTAMQLWQGNLIARRNANADAKRDREDILADIEAYKSTFSDETIAAAVAQEQQAWNTKIAETLQSAQQQAAAQGRVLDNTTYAMLRGRLEAQAAQAIQLVQMQYEQKRSEIALNAIQAKNDVYKNTSRTIETPAEIATIIQALAGK
jgi:hypothetical protein